MYHAQILQVICKIHHNSKWELSDILRINISKKKSRNLAFRKAIQQARLQSCAAMVMKKIQ